MGALSRIFTLSSLAALVAFAVLATPDSVTARTPGSQWARDSDSDRDHGHDRDSPHVKPSCKAPKLKWSPKLAEYSEKYADKLKGDCKLAFSDKKKEERTVCSFPNGVVRVIDSKDSQNLVAAAVRGNKDLSYNDAVCKVYDNVKKSDKCYHGKFCGYNGPVDIHSLTRYGCAKVPCFKSKDVLVICHFSDGDKPGKHY